MPQIFEHPAEMRKKVRSWQSSTEKVALVTTMGALHAGHLSLIDEARKHARKIVVSIFVNPTQFGENEDFDNYPRTMETDLASLRKYDVEAVYAPSAKIMYPDGFATTVEVAGPALELETEFRPHFFKGVATVVSKLLLGVGADYAIFGEKDYQQLLVVKQMVEDLNIPVEIIGSPTLREKDGLAMSSRNQYLSPEERAVAAEIIKSLNNCADAIKSGTAHEEALKEATNYLTKAGFTVDYVSLRDARTLKTVSPAHTEQKRLLVAARLGQTRLIDNIAVG